jgi:hypothetical protein
MAEEKLIVSDRPERAANDLTDQIERVPVIVYRLVLMVSSTNTADDDGVMMYDILTGEYYGQTARVNSTLSASKIQRPLQPASMQAYPQASSDVKDTLRRRFPAYQKSCISTRTATTTS